MAIVPHENKQIQNYHLALTALPSAKAHSRKQMLQVNLKCLKRLFEIKVPNP